MLLNSKGQVTIPAHLRAKHNLHEGDDIEIVEVAGTLQIVRADKAPTRGQRIARRLRGTTSNKDIESLSTDEIMGLLRGE